MKGSVEQVHPFADENVGGVLGLGRLVEPALRLLLIGEGGEGSDRRRPPQRQRRGFRLGVGAPRSAPALGGRGRRTQGPDDEDALALATAGARQVAAVRQRQRACEVELRESE